MTATAHSSLEGRISENVRRIDIRTRRLTNDCFQGGVQSRFRGRGMEPRL